MGMAAAMASAIMTAISAARRAMSPLWLSFGTWTAAENLAVPACGRGFAGEAAVFLCREPDEQYTITGTPSRMP